MNSLKYYLPGIIIIMAAVIIVAVPEILIVFLSALITIAGIVALYVGHQIRKSEIGLSGNENRFFNDFLGRRFAGIKVIRRWDR